MSELFLLELFCNERRTTTTMGRLSLLLVVFTAAAAVVGLAGASFRDECDIPWEPQNARFTDDGNGLSLSLVSNYSGHVHKTFFR